MSKLFYGLVSKNAFSLAKLPYSLYHNCLLRESSIPLLAIQNKDII